MTKHNNGKGMSLFVTILAWVLFTVVAVSVLPVVLPRIGGYHAYTLNEDFTRKIKMVSSVVYTDNISLEELDNGDIVAVKSDNGKKVDVYFVSSNNDQAQTMVLRTDATVKNDQGVVDYDQIVGHVYASAPFIGVLTQLCDAVLGIVFVVFVFIVGAVLAIIANRLVVKAKPEASAN